jgi:hypothetical protein
MARQSAMVGAIGFLAQHMNAGGERADGEIAGVGADWVWKL